MKITAIEPIGVSEQRMQAIKNRFADEGHQFYYFSDRETEPEILKAKNTVTLPHIGFATEEGIQLRSEIVVENILSWIDGKPARVMN